MKLKILSLFLIFLDILKINNLFRFFNRNRALILWYHGICDDSFSLLSGYDERHIPKSLFREHLSYLKQKGYVFMTMSELIDIFKNKKEIKKVVVLTFDDGFQNVVENAYPIMKEFNAKGCFYIVSSLIGTNRLLWTDYIETVVSNSNKREFEFIFKGQKKYYTLDTKKSCQKAMKDIKKKLRTISDKERIEHLQQFHDTGMDNVNKEFLFATWEHIKSLDKGILEVGSHTRNHPNCVNLISKDEFKNEIENSKIEIEEMVNYRIDHFCYPAGSYSEEVIKNIKNYGYKSAVTIMHGFNTKNNDLYKLKRIAVNESFLFFKATTSGSLSLIIRLWVYLNKRFR